MNEMRVFPYTGVEAKDTNEGASKLKVRWLITKEMGAPNFAMRVFEMEPRGNSPLHTHPWEHEVFVLKGRGVVVGEHGEENIVPGNVVFVPPNELHQFKNTGKMTLMFLCLVPISHK
jgi:quercetin dioxygenase-like cupin family protein